MTAEKGDQTTESGTSLLRKWGRIAGGLGALPLAGCVGNDENGDDENGDDNDNNNNNNDNNNNNEEERERPDWDTDPDAATNWDNYTITQLDSHDNMMAMTVAPDGRVFYTTRGGNAGSEGDSTAFVNYVYPDSGETGTALELDVRVTFEDGARGIALDPDFEDNGWVYIFYVPPDGAIETPDDPYMLVSRFEVTGDEIDPDSETEVIRIPHQRTHCCHTGGDLAIGPKGDLYISTGDNMTDQIQYVPVDESNTGPDQNTDAQGTSADTSDLRGKVLRITPEDEGSYSIPDGNLKDAHEAAVGETFPDGLFRPEIYVMGLRNPYTIAVDEWSGHLHVADYGPNADDWDDDRGPMGNIEWRVVCEPVNAGWPFFHAYYPYRRYDFETGEIGQPYWPDNLRNTSVNNDGIEKLPPVTPADVWFPRSWDSYVQAPAWVDMPRPGEPTWQPDLPDGVSAHTGARYRYSDDFGAGALDPYFDGKQFVMTPFNDDWMGYFTYNDDGSVEIDEFLPDADIPMPFSMEYGPDGRLFVQSYGTEFGGSGGGIYVVEYEP